MMTIMGTDAPTKSMRVLEGLDVPCEIDAPLGPLTWYRVGGRAEILARPRSAKQLGELAARCHCMRVPLRVIGRGANLLVPDEGVPGVVVQLSDPVFKQVGINGSIVTAGGGVDLAKLIHETARHGLGGLDGLAGIPASVGGAVRMNAGGAYGSTGQTVLQVTVMDELGRVRTLKRQQITFDYRRSSIAEPLILEAQFELTPDDPAAVRRRVKEVFDYKTSTQPLADKSAGCAFKNPPKHVSEKGAGRLIDEAGLKGFRIGGAEVSPIHANFITVDAASGGTATDVLTVMDHVRKVVADRFGIELEREVVVWR